MAPPAQHVCSFPGCNYGPDQTPYTTVENLPSHDLVIQDLRIHMDIHVALSRTKVAPSNSAAKVTKLERLTVSHQCTNVEWELFSKQWTRYKRSTEIEGQVLLDQLWVCMDSALEKSANNNGADNENTEPGLMARIKRLAVKGQNILVNQVVFLKMGQDRDEPVLSFMSRLRGQARLCKFSVQCSHCNTQTSYQEAIMCHQLVRAIADPEI